MKNRTNKNLLKCPSCGFGVFTESNSRECAKCGNGIMIFIERKND